ncbi:MAG: DEAD/DEAH box helicase family protein, partial [Sulfobacillus sp.]
PDPFGQLFGFSHPNAIQQALITLDPHDPRTQTLVLESETGSGKTEAALAWFARLFAAGIVDSLYFALPTRVAATELYRRIETYMTRWFPDPSVRPVVVQAVPGYNPPSALPFVDPTEDRLWAAQQPKRFLAATIAVGTIDQALLSGIQI